MVDEKIRETIIGFQENEITEHYVYRRLARKTKGKNSEVLDRISKDELRSIDQYLYYHELK